MVTAKHLVRAEDSLNMIDSAMIRGYLRECFIGQALAEFLS